MRRGVTSFVVVVFAIVSVVSTCSHPLHMRQIPAFFVYLHDFFPSFFLLYLYFSGSVVAATARPPAGCVPPADVSVLSFSLFSCLFVCFCLVLLPVSSKCLGPDCVPYLPLLMPPLLAAASANVRQTTSHVVTRDVKWIDPKPHHILRSRVDGA